MGELSFDNISDGSEFNLFDDSQDTSTPEENVEETQEQEDNTTEIDPESLFEETSESVGSGEDKKTEKDTHPSEDRGTSPNFYSSIAEAFATDGIFPDLTDEEIKNVKTPEDLRNLVDNYLNNALDDQQRRVKEALDLDADTATIRQFEGSLNFLNSIDDTAIRAENEQGELLRKRLIYQDFLNRGFSKERAEKEVNKSVDNGNDIDDAIEALNGLKTFYESGYQNYIDGLKQQEAQKKQLLEERNKRIKNAIFDTKSKVFGDIEIDKPTRQKMYDSLIKPIYKNEETGEFNNAIMDYASKNDEDFWVKLSYLFVATDGFKSLDKLIGSKVKKGIKRGFKDLEGKINATSRASDGSLSFISGVNDDESYFGKGMKFDF